jgi:hypothetical protein
VIPIGNRLPERGDLGRVIDAILFLVHVAEA